MEDGVLRHSRTSDCTRNVRRSKNLWRSAKAWKRSAMFWFCSSGEWIERVRCFAVAVTRSGVQEKKTVSKSKAIRRTANN